MPLRTTENIIELAGNTPLLHLGRFCRPPRADIYAKPEYRNPGGAVKDRAALGMILDAEARGVLRQGVTIIEPTAGNSGIGLAVIGKIEGIAQYQVIPANFDSDLADEIMMIMDDKALATVRRLAMTEVVLGGGSTGAAAALRHVERPGKGNRVVPVFPDRAERYMSQGILDQ